MQTHSISYKAYRIFETQEGFKGIITQCKISDLPENEVLVKVLYSGINYKDFLSSCGNKGITKKYPHTPGIDAAGIVETSASDLFKKGDQVVIMGYDLGMNTDGGFGGYIRVPAAWIVPLPENFTLKETMLLGTSGFTAALGIHKLLLMGQCPELGPVVVSGATGGVGSFAVEILSGLGFEVWAASGKQNEEYLKSLGASKILAREEINDTSGKALLRPSWAGAFDTVGGNILATLVKGCKKLGSVTTCGNVAGAELPVTVFPFILNGINLLGINAADTPMNQRLNIWKQLSGGWKPRQLESIGNVITPEQIGEALEAMRNGSHSGRFVIRHEENF
ncbi:MAG: YhdH/YhfP family quinone oxidoreductase [Bacteroidales bacterium]|nr:YhdH/YhfP family quinone oxidoreductase [Bacteroidales bacterium]